MRYKESRPSERFAKNIKCYWSLGQAMNAEGGPQPVLPDGCPEIVFNFSDRFRRFHRENEFEIQPRTLVAGQMSCSILIGPSGKVDLFGVRFQPAGAFGIFGFPVCDLTDKIESVFDVWGGTESLLYEALAEADLFTERIAIFEGFLAARLNGHYYHSPDLEYAIGRLRNGAVTVRSVVKDLGWSERRLERRFSERVGVTPKMFSRIMRFQRLVHVLETDGSADLADAAIACGYYDQPHMNREFAAFAGTSPTIFLEASHRMSELFVTGE